MIRHALILAGGQGHRFGGDKLAHRIDGVAMLDRVVAAARSALLEPLVVGRLPTPADDWRGIPDAVAGQGPLAGLIAGLERVRAPALVLAGDLPRLTPDLLRWLIDEDDPSCEVIAAGTDAGPEPLCAIWRPGALPAAASALAAGERALHRLIDRLDHRLVPVPAEHLPALRNVNTRDDLP